MIKTFRGIMEDGGQQRIRLSTKKGKIGYKIVKFKGFPNLPATVDYESLLQVFKVKQTTVPTGTPTVDFADGNLLAALYYTGMASTYNANSNMVMFEQEIFNQDIYITHTAAVSTFTFNYYLELEVMTLSDNATLVSTLRDIRLNPQVGA